MWNEVEEREEYWCVENRLREDLLVNNGEDSVSFDFEVSDFDNFETWHDKKILEY